MLIKPGFYKEDRSKFQYYVRFGKFDSSRQPLVLSIFLDTFSIPNSKQLRNHTSKWNKYTQNTAKWIFVRFGCCQVRRLKRAIHNTFFVLRQVEVLCWLSISCGCSNSLYNTAKSLFSTWLMYNLWAFCFCCKTVLSSFLPHAFASGVIVTSSPGASRGNSVKVQLLLSAQRKKLLLSTKTREVFSCV